MTNTRFLLAAALLAAPFTAYPQSSLKDGTALSWNHEISVGTDSIAVDSISLPALTIPVYEAKTSDVWGLLKTELPGSDFKKAGSVMRTNAVSLGGSAAMDAVARVDHDKKANTSTLVMAFMNTGGAGPVDNESLKPAMRDLGVRLNKAVVQGQVKEWEKKLDKADSKTESAAKSQEKVESKVGKSQKDLEKAAKEKSKLQKEHAVLQKQIDLENEKWQMSQDPKDLKRLTKSRSKITKNEGKMAKVMDREAKAQKALSKSTGNLPDAQKAKDEKAAQQAEVQRTVDALQRKLENIR